MNTKTLLVRFLSLALMASMPVVVSAAYGEASYYGQSTYYAQGTYYSQSTYYAQATYFGTPRLTITANVTALQDVNVTGSIHKGSGSFVIDDPLDPANKLLFHSFVESPDAKNLYDGIITLDKNGEAVIQLPAYFEALNKDFRYQAKPITEAMPDIYIKSEIANNQFTISGGTAFGRVSWQVTGIRHDPYILANPIIPEVEKGPGQIVDKGEYLFEGYAGGWWHTLTRALSSAVSSILDLFR